MPHAKVSERQRNRAKGLRKSMAPAETLLWRYIKANRIDGLSFRRQLPIRNYIADFVCMSAKLIVEIDGASHEFAERITADAARDAFFKSQAFLKMRFANADVLGNLAGLVEVIRQAAMSRIDMPPSLTLPHMGGGNTTSDVLDEHRRGQP